MTNHADFVARLVDAGLDAEQAEQVARELVPPDPLAAFTRSMFAQPDDNAEPPPDPPTPGHVATEGGNPNPRNRSQADLRNFTRGLFHLDP